MQNETYLERRYNDIKQVLEACYSYWDPELMDLNYLFEALEDEFNLLADKLGFEDVGAFLDRLCPDDAE